jgi:hypothetical protein
MECFHNIWNYFYLTITLLLGTCVHHGDGKGFQTGLTKVGSVALYYYYNNCYPILMRSGLRTRRRSQNMPTVEN